MDVTGNEPDEVTEAALEAVSEAVELAGRPQPQSPPAGRHRLRDRVRRRRWLSAQVLAMAPRLPVRDLETLRSQFPERSPDELAEALIEGASRASAAVGVAVGAWAVLPFIPAAGVEITTETLAVVGIEIKLVAELHEVYGQATPGSVVERMTSYVGAWAQRRGVALVPGGLVLAAGSPLARQLQRRLAARAGRSLFSLGPLLTGAAAGGLINRSQTRKLGRAVSDDLRKRSPHGSGWPT